MCRAGCGNGRHLEWNARQIQDLDEPPGISSRMLRTIMSSSVIADDALASSTTGDAGNAAIIHQLAIVIYGVSWSNCTTSAVMISRHLHGSPPTAPPCGGSEPSLGLRDNHLSTLSTVYTRFVQSG